MAAALKFQDALVCRRQRGRPNKDGATGKGIVALGDDDDDSVSAVENLGGDEEVGGDMVVEGKVGGYCSYSLSILVDGVGLWLLDRVLEGVSNREGGVCSVNTRVSTGG